MPLRVRLSGRSNLCGYRDRFVAPLLAMTIKSLFAGRFLKYIFGMLNILVGRAQGFACAMVKETGFLYIQIVPFSARIHIFT